ncbi:DUF2254 domain-containing protein [Mycolicibacterium fluoranthenivorans]|nr:DUF2254 domain-containing protein [Mycolicibacterium fluoranthenivorans]
MHSRLWPIPAAAVVAAIGVGVALTNLEELYGRGLPPALSDHLFGGDADAARSVLTVIAGSLMTVTSLTFSLTVLTLQLASSQFSPRLLRTFTGDRFVQGSLALLLATFAFALTVLRTVRAGPGDVEFVPQLSVTLAYLLAMTSVLTLVLFLAHLVREIRVESMVSTVHVEAGATMRRLLDPSAEIPIGAPPTPPPDAVLLTAGASGFLTRVDEVALLAAAQDTGTVVLIDREPGSSLIARTPIGYAWALASQPVLDKERVQELQARVARAVATGFERTSVDDLGYGLRQLTDVATKALSPGINDPTTAIHTLGHSAALLCEFAAHTLGPKCLLDDEDRVRVVLRRPGLAELLELAIGAPRHYGAGDVAVLDRVFALLRELAWCADQPEHRSAIHDQLERTRAVAARQTFDAAERNRMRDAAIRVEDALDGRWPPQ